MIKGIAPIFLLAILMASFAGFGYSLWYEDLTLTGTIDTTYMDAAWSLHGVCDSEKKNVSNIVAALDQVDNNKMTVTITEAYPCVDYVVVFDITSKGPLPIHIDNLTVTKPVNFPGTIEICQIKTFANPQTGNIQFVGGAGSVAGASYFEWTFGQTIYNAWCVDLQRTIGNGEKISNLYCSYGDGLPYPTPEMDLCRWGKLNWIVNNWMDYPGFTWSDAQVAIWLVVYNGAPPSNPYNAAGIGNPVQTNVETLLADAVCCWTPDCATDKMLVLIRTPAADGSQQYTIAEFPCCCSAGDFPIQLHKDQSAWFMLKVHLNNDAVQDYQNTPEPEYTFTITTIAHQYNEDPILGLNYPKP